MYPEKNLSEQGREPTKINLHVTPRPGIENRATLVGGERSHHCAILPSLKVLQLEQQVD